MLETTTSEQRKPKAKRERKKKLIEMKSTQFYGLYFENAIYLCDTIMEYTQRTLTERKIERASERARVAQLPLTTSTIETETDCVPHPHSYIV